MLKPLAVVLLLGLPAAAQSQNADSLALARRAEQVAAMLGGAPIKADTIFASSFLARVPEAQLRNIATGMATLGRVKSMTMTSRPVPGGPPTSAVFRLITEKSFSIQATLVLDPAAPNLVTGLFFGSPVQIAGTLDDAVRDFRALHGQASLFVARVDGSRLVPIVAEDTSRAMAIGSAFKLYVLAELVNQIQAGKRHWADVVPVDSLSKSLPSGFLQTWPAGTPVTLQTLATLMISISDNTAADHLLHILGRENVERIQSAAGNSNPRLNQPFLTTRELFALKNADNADALRRYIAGTPAERRAILASPGITSRQERAPDFSHGPIAIEHVEWFATTADLARIMVWLRDHSASGPASAARGVLSVNKGIEWAADQWRYVGFKGGSEPGVLNATFLAQRADGQWMVFVFTWNDPAKPVDELAFIGLTSRIRDLAAFQVRRATDPPGVGYGMFVYRLPER